MGFKNIFLLFVIIGLASIANAQCDDFELNLQQQENISCWGQDNGQVLLEAVGGAIPYNFYYTLDNGPSQGPFANGTFTNLEEGAYSFTVIDQNNCSEILNLQITEPSNPGLFIEGLEDEYCVDMNPVNLTGWPSGGFFFGPGISANSFDPTDAGEGNHIITYYYNDDVNDCFYSVDYQVYVAGNTYANPLFPLTYCATDTSTYDLIADQGTGTFLGPGVENNTFNPSNVGIGNHIISYFFFDGICANQIEYEIEVFVPQIYINFELNDLELTLEGPTDADQWNWQMPDGSILNGQSVDYIFEDYGLYSVCLTASFQGCELLICELINVVEDPINAEFEIDDNDDLFVVFDNLSSGADGYFWDFGDGNTSTEQFPTHVYEDGGSYQICLTVFNATSTDVHCEFVYFDCFIGEADFYWATNGLVVSFANNSQDTQLYNWDFGNGNSINFENPTYTFPVEGVYEVCLTAINECGSTVTCKEVTVVCPVPETSLTINADNYDYQFIASPGGSQDYTLSLGDGTVTNNLIVNHTYDQLGFYTVCFSATNDCGVKTICETIEVTCPWSEATFDYVFDNLTLNIENTASDYETLLWDFGDGTTSTDDNPTHEYAAQGDYLVCLFTYSECGDDQICQNITIDCSPSAGISVNTVNQFEVSFDNISANADTYEWTVNGNIVSTDLALTYEFTDDGLYEVCLSVSNSCGTDEDCETVELLCPEIFAIAQVDSFNQFDYFLSLDSIQGNFGSNWLIDNVLAGNGIMLDYTFENAGIYNLCLELYDYCDTTQLCQDIEVACPEINADFSIENPNGPQDEIQINLTAETDQNLTYEWTVDGNPVTGSGPETFIDGLATGIYEICLTTSNICDEVTNCLTHFYLCPTPDASITTVNISGLTIQLQADDGPDYTDWIWSLDGTEIDSGSSTLNYTLDGEGVYQFCVEVSNVCGTEDNCEFISITCAPPTADFSVSESFGNNYLFEAVFTADAYNWTSNGQNIGSDPSIDYQIYVPWNESVSFEICLEMINQCGIDTQCQSITADSDKSIQVDLTPVSCFGGMDGSALLTLECPGQADLIFDYENLSSGIQIIEFSDGISDYSTEIDVPQNTLLEIEYLSVPPLCNDDESGAIDFSGSGGVLPYMFELNGNLVNEGFIQGLAAGVYELSITDSLGCSESISIELINPDGIEIEIDSVQAATNADGSIDLTISGGIEPIEIEWSNGAVSEDLDNLEAGIYTITVTDANDCSQLLSIEVPAIVDIPIYISSNVSVYPNPASDWLYIDSELPVERISCLDASGKLLAESFHTRQINIQHIAPGIYFIEVVHLGRKETIKVLKNH